MPDYRALTEAEIETMTKAGCTAADWTQVLVGDGFDPARVRNVQFLGKNAIGALSGTVSVGGIDLQIAKLKLGLVGIRLLHCRLVGFCSTQHSIHTSH